MLLSVVSVLVVAQSSSEITEGLMNNPVYWTTLDRNAQNFICIYLRKPNSSVSDIATRQWGVNTKAATNKIPLSWYHEH